MAAEIPETFIRDEYEDEDNTPLQDHTPPVGGAWEPLDFFGSGTAEETRNARVKNNHAESIGSGGPTRAYRNAQPPPSADYLLGAPIRTTGNGNSANGYMVLLARMSPTGISNADVDRYFFAVRPGSTNTGRIVKVVNGTATELASTNIAVATHTDYIMEFDVTDALKVGRLIRVSDSAVIFEISTDDNEITQAGRAGVALSQNNFEAAWMDRVEVTILPMTPVKFIAIEARDDSKAIIQGRDATAVALSARDDSGVSLEARRDRISIEAKV